MYESGACMKAASWETASWDVAGLTAAWVVAAWEAAVWEAAGLVCDGVAHELGREMGFGLTRWGRIGAVVGPRQFWHFTCRFSVKKKEKKMHNTEIVVNPDYFHELNGNS